MIGLRWFSRILAITGREARIEHSDEMRALTLALDDLKEQVVSGIARMERLGSGDRKIQEVHEIMESKGRNGGQRLSRFP